MKASDIMTPNPISVEPTASVMQAVRLMLQHRVSGLPVVAGSGTLVGIITERDLLSRGETGSHSDGRPRWLEFLIGPGPLAPEYAQACKRKVHEVMSPEVFTASEDSTFETIVQIMDRRGIKRLPILRGEKLVGIVSRADLVRALARMTLVAVPANAEPDDINPESKSSMEDEQMTPQSGLHGYVNWAKARLDEMDATLAAFASKVGKLEADARTRADKALAGMRMKRDAFREAITKEKEAGEAAWARTQVQLKADWQAFETHVRMYIDAAGTHAAHRQAAFRVRAEAQRKSWQDATDGVQQAAVAFSAGRKADLDVVIRRMNAEAATAKAKLDKLSHAGSESWSALEKALAETRAAFDRANQAMHDAFKGVDLPASQSSQSLR